MPEQRDVPPDERAKIEGRKRRLEKAEAQFGFDVVGEDGRRIFRGLPETQARLEAARITSISGEDLDVVAAEGPAPSVLGPSPSTEFPPIAENLKAPEGG